MSGKWLSIEVLDGPQSLQGKVAKVKLDFGGDSYVPGIWVRELGRVEFMQMYGDFAGLEKISRNHLSIQHNEVLGEFRLIDCNSTNGTEFPNGNDGKEVIAVLGGVLEIKVTQSLENFTITPESFIVPAPRMSESGYSPPQVMDDESLMNLISSEIKKACQKTGMSWQLRRGWDIREKPVDQSTLSDYQWKIIPKNGDEYQSEENPLIPGEHYDKEIGFGSYYLVFARNSELFFEHSGSFVGILTHHHFCHHYVVQDGFWNTPNQSEPGFYNFEISEWLMQCIEKYPPSHYSIT